MASSAIRLADPRDADGDSQIGNPCLPAGGQRGRDVLERALRVAADDHRRLGERSARGRQATGQLFDA